MGSSGIKQKYMGRRVLSPRRLDLNQRTSIEKASMRPDLWIFASYDKCKQKFSKELCDYFDSRMIHPIQLVNNDNYILYAGSRKKVSKRREEVFSIFLWKLRFKVSSI